MKCELYDVAVTRDLPEYRLRRGEIVKLVDHHVAPNGTEGYSTRPSMPWVKPSPLLPFLQRLLKSSVGMMCCALVR